MNEKITGIMPTINAVRHPFVLMSIKCFLEQDYPNKELLIVNQGEPINYPDPRVKEIFIAPVSIGEARNAALDRIKDGYAVVWDDDDWRHPQYLSLLSSEVDKDRGYVCYAHKNTLGVDYNTGMTSYNVGAHNSYVLFDASTLRHRYPDSSMGEDQVFKWAFDEVIWVDMPANYYVRFHHGDNVCSWGMIMYGQQTDEYKEQIDKIIESIHSNN